ncbi:MAG: XcyI family restriction endonuclease [Chloroflexi bacterium]|nr:XcyI family restriction endonuclease [Chloroflexota bacterium]
MTNLDDAVRRSAVMAERIKQRSDIQLRELIGTFAAPLDFSRLDDLMISRAAWAHVAASSFDPKSVFAHPDLLIEHPRLSEYYRGIALLSQKRVAPLAANVTTWEDPNRKIKAKVNAERAMKVARLYNAVISSIIEGSTGWTLENGYRNILANMGIGLDGTIRNLIGQDAEQLVKRRIKEWLETEKLILGSNAEGTQFQLPDNYAMRYGSEPDIEFRQLVNGQPVVVATIEIKGGKDPAGALERLGAVQKSFEATPTNCVNMLVAGIVTAEMERRLAELKVNKTFMLDDLSGNGPKWEEFLNEVFHYTIRITSSRISVSST